MESKWRQNVHDMYMSYSDWRLAARLVEDPGYVVVAIWPYPNPDYAIFDVSDPNQLPEFVGEFHITPADPHFPYGWEVEPD